MSQFMGLPSLKGRAVDGGVEFECDDCHDRHVLPTFGSDRSVPDALTKPWTLTKRKQRCPSCSEVARARGWVQ